MWENETLNTFADMLLLNLSWIIATLPVITAGASMSAMYIVMRKRMQGTGEWSVSLFWRRFHEELKTATPLWLLELFVLGIAILCFHFSTMHFAEAPFFFGFLECTSVLVLIMTASLSCFLYPLLSCYENTIFQQVRNACLLAITHPFRTIAVLLLWAAPAYLALFMPVLFLRIGFLLPTIAFSFLFYISGRLLLPVVLALGI